MRKIGFVAVALLAGCVQAPEQTASKDFQTYCADCHGSDARGDGPLSMQLGLNAPDLTRIRDRSDGEFPFTRVMSVIDGYTRADQHGTQMPQFGPLLEGEMVLLEYENGAATPTPARLIALAEYLESVQE